MPYLSLFPNPEKTDPFTEFVVHIRTPFHLGQDLDVDLQGEDTHFVELVKNDIGLFVGETVLEELKEQGFHVGQIITVELRTSVLSECETDPLPGGKVYPIEVEIKLDPNSSFLGIGDESVLNLFKEPKIDTTGLAVPEGTKILEANEDRCNDDPGVPRTNHRGPEFEKDIRPYLKD